MGSFSWTHLIIAILIIVFVAMGSMYNWLVIVLAAILAILSIFGVCSCSHSKRGYYNKREVKPNSRKKRRK
jgi:hypothetical protein